MDFDFGQLLVERAGLSQSILEKGKRDPGFEAILSAMERIHSGKQVLYGDYMKTHGESPTALIEHFCDIKRKFVRAQGFIAGRLRGEKHDLIELLDTYTDIAVYGALGVQLLQHLMDKERNSEPSGSS